MRPEEEFNNLVSEHLESLIPQFERELSSVLNQSFPNEVKFLQIEYDSPTFSDEFSVCMYAMNKEGKLIGKVHWFLKGAAVVVPPEIYESEKYEEIEPWSVASSILESWLRKRWANAGNQRYPTYMSHHDSYFLSNIHDGKDTNRDAVFERSNG